MRGRAARLLTDIARVYAAGGAGALPWETVTTAYIIAARSGRGLSMGDDEKQVSGPQWPSDGSWETPAAPPAGPGPGTPTGMAYGPWPGPGMPPGMTPAPGTGRPPGMAPGLPADRPRKRSRLLMAVLISVAVLAVACAGTVGYGAVRLATNLDAARDRAARPTAPALPAPSAPADAGQGEEDVAEGPRASSYPVRTADDLARVCDGWYYPQSPKYLRSAVNSVQVLAKDSMDFRTRIERSLYDIPDRSPAVKPAWDPPGPQKVRLAACVDLVEGGKRVRTCEFDDPKGRLPMREGVYRLTLYEVATGTRLTEKRLTGENRDCPFLVLLGADRTVYSELEDRQLYEVLRRYVEK